MNVDIFTFCESVHNYNGKLVIVGTFNAIDSSKFPFCPTELSLVINVAIDEADGKDFTGRLIINKKDNDKITLIDVPVPIQNTLSHNGGKSYVNFIGSLAGIIIPEPGHYVAVLTIDDFKREIDLYVTERK